MGGDFTEHIVPLFSDQDQSNQNQEQCELCRGPLSASNRYRICYRCQDKEIEKASIERETEIMKLSSRQLNSSHQLNVDNNIDVLEKWKRKV